MGPQPLISEKAQKVGVTKTYPLAHLDEFVGKAANQGRKVHFLPPYRYHNMIQLHRLLGIPFDQMKSSASVEFIKGVVSLRLIKEECEVAEIEKACNIGYKMHYTAMKTMKLGMVEQELVGIMEGISISEGLMPSFPIILSQNGETLHNHSHHQILTEGRLLVIDAGAETNTNYTSDFTRTLPSSGKFTQQQKEIYSIVSAANNLAVDMARPGITYSSVHQAASRVMAQGLVNLGLLKGDVDEIVAAGAHSLFMPHGLGHNMGMDVHDMEDLGENYVGYDDTYKRSTQFGLGSLRMGKMLEKGHVVTVEPGIYFIPALIEQWKREGTNAQFINFGALEQYYNFGGIRLEDDILITDNGSRLLGDKRLPITVEDVEREMEN
jgi:Xaa-Pro aminopeptidase